MASMGKSLATDLCLLPYEVEVNRVYTAALKKVDVLSSREVEEIGLALDRIIGEYESGAYKPEELPDEDVHSLIERRLTELVGSPGEKIHTGRSRNDLVMTDVRMLLRDECVGLISQIKELGGSILEKADEYQAAIMPGYTHLQRAQPILLAHYLCSFAFSLRSDAKRLKGILRGELSRMPLGAGALAGSAFPINREWIAKKLGFEGVTENSIQTVSSRDEFLEIGNALSMLMIHLSRYAEDLIIWSSTEFGFVSLGDSVSTGSSMMPQKKNPDSLELIRGKAARVIGNYQTLLTLLKGLPLTYDRDLQEDKPALFDMIDQAEISLEMFREAMSTIAFDAQRMRASIGDEMAATDLADYLVKKGIPFRKSHEVVAKLFREHTSGSISEADLKNASDLFGSDAVQLLNPEEGIKLRDVVGGTSLESVKDQRKELGRFFKE